MPWQLARRFGEVLQVVDTGAAIVADGQTGAEWRQCYSADGAGGLERLGLSLVGVVQVKGARVLARCPDEQVGFGVVGQMFGELVGEGGEVRGFPLGGGEVELAVFGGGDEAVRRGHGGEQGLVGGEGKCKGGLHARAQQVELAVAAPSGESGVGWIFEIFQPRQAVERGGEGVALVGGHGPLVGAVVLVGKSLAVTGGGFSHYVFDLLCAEGDFAFSKA